MPGEMAWTPRSRRAQRKEKQVPGGSLLGGIRTELNPSQEGLRIGGKLCKEDFRMRGGRDRGRQWCGESEMA